MDLSRNLDAEELPGIAVEFAEFLNEGRRAADAVSELIEAADFMTGRNAGAAEAVPIANQLYLLSSPLISAGDLQHARQALDRTAVILRAAFGDDAVCVGTVLKDLADAETKAGDAETGGRMRAEALAIAMKHAGFSGPQVYAVTNDIKAPTLTRQVEPKYTEEARRAWIEGTVILSLVIEPDGKAGNFATLMPLGFGLDEKAVEAVQQWEFQPCRRESDHQPVACQARINVNFRLR